MRAQRMRLTAILSGRQARFGAAAVFSKDTANLGTEANPGSFKGSMAVIIDLNDTLQHWPRHSLAGWLTAKTS
ncbi:MAG: hypothetical protein CMQ11_08820 [Gammaproteobacteria bacterium]|nr:hypothetical protein [Gammaproteobacteria bacterium]